MGTHRIITIIRYDAYSRYNYTNIIMFVIMSKKKYESPDNHSEIGELSFVVYKYLLYSYGMYSFLNLLLYQQLTFFKDLPDTCKQLAKSYT